MADFLGLPFPAADKRYMPRQRTGAAPEAPMPAKGETKSAPVQYAIRTQQRIAHMFQFFIILQHDFRVQLVIRVRALAEGSVGRDDFVVLGVIDGRKRREGEGRKRGEGVGGQSVES